MTITTPRSRSRFTPVITIVALLAAFGTSFAASPARAADRPLNAIDVWEVDLRDRNRVTISADVTVTGSDGRQTTSNIIAVLIGFMDYTDDACLADGVDASSRGISDGTSNTILLGGLISSPLGVVRGIVQAPPGGPAGFAIDVGTSEALLFQDGDELFLFKFDGSTVRLLGRKTIPPGSSVTMEDVLISGYWIGAQPGSATCIAR